MREKSSSFLEGWAGWLGRSRLRLASAQMSYGRGSWRSTVPVFRVPCSASPVESQWLKLLKLWNPKLSIPVQPSPGHGSCTRHCLFVVLLCVAFEAHSSWWLRDLPETLDSLSQIPRAWPRWFLWCYSVHGASAPFSSVPYHQWWGIPQTTWSPFKLVQGTNLNFARLLNFLAIFMICVALICTRAEPEEVSWTRPLHIKRTTGCRNSNRMLICGSLQLCLATQTCILGRGLWGGMLSSWMSVQRQGTVLFTWGAVLILPGPVWFTSDPSSAQREACYSMFWYFLAWIISLYAFFVYLGPKMPKGRTF